MEPDLERARKRDVLVRKDEERQKDLWQQIQALEKSQPLTFQRMPSSPLSPKDLQEIQSIASHQAGMSMSEVEQLIEWEAYSFTRQETDALAAWVHTLAKPNGALTPRKLDAHPAHNPYTTALAPRVRVSGYVPEKRWGWHFEELQLFIAYCFGLAPRLLAQQPLKVPSGKYVETLKVERTQQDLIADMVLELLELQPHTAYVKSAGWKGKIQTVVVDKAAAALLSTGGRELVDVRGSIQKKALEDRILKERSAIEAEIRARQDNWRRTPGNDAPPPQHSDDDSSPALPAGRSGEDRAPSMTPSQPVDTPDQAPSMPTLPLAFESLRFYESGTAIGEHKERQYSTQFPKHSARYIKFELGVKNLQSMTDQTHQLMYRYINPDGSLLGETQSAWLVKSTSAMPSYSWGWGWEEPGHWQPGTYRVAILIDGVEFAEGSFTITGSVEPPPRHTDDDTTSLSVGQSSEDRVPSLTPSVPLSPAEEPPPRSEDVSPAQAEIVDVAILLDGVEFAEEPFTITENAAEPPPQAIPDTTAEEPPETSAVDQSSTGIEERGELTPPPWHIDEGSSSALPVAQRGEDHVPSLIPAQAVEIPDQASSTPALPFQLESFFDESGIAIGTKIDIFIDETERAEEAFTITEDAAEHQPPSETPPSTHCESSTTHEEPPPQVRDWAQEHERVPVPPSAIPDPTPEEPPPDTSTALPSSTVTDDSSEPTGREPGNIIELASYRHKHSEQEHASALPSPEATLEEPIPGGLSLALAPQPRPTPVVEFMSLEFFESGKGMPEIQERQYATSFSKRTARFVNCALTLRNLRYQERSETYPVTIRYFNPDGSLLWEGQHDWVMSADEDQPSYSWGWGWEEPGWWYVGSHRVELLIDDVVLAEGFFTITEDAAEQAPASVPAGDKSGCVPETTMGAPGKTGEADTEHHQERQEPSRLLAPQDHLATTGETQPSILAEVGQSTTIPSPEAPVYELPDGVVVVEEAFTITENTAEPLPNQEQQPLTTTARKKTPSKIPRLPVPGFKLVSVHFYESGKEYLPQGERQYATHFSKRTARYVNADLVLRNRLYKKKRQTFHVEVRAYKPDGTLESTIEDDNSLTSSYKEWGLPVRWWCEEPDTWELGTYRIAILIDGVEIGAGSFTMTDSVELPSPPLVPSTTSAEPQPVSGRRQRERSSLSVIWDALAWYVKKLAGSGSA
jgi:hypothetical protein